MAKTMSTPLRFSELAVGEHFIGFPMDGDDSGHGGYRRGSYVFRKLSDEEDGCDNSYRLIDGIPSAVPPSMPVLKVLV